MQCQQSEGMNIKTNTKFVEKATARHVMEFLLANHPLRLSCM